MLSPYRPPPGVRRVPGPIKSPYLMLNIRVDGTGTTKYASPTVYESEVWKILLSLKASAVGSAVLDEIHNHYPRRVVIQSYEGNDLGGAFSHPTQEGDALAVGVSEDGYHGDGKGSDTVVSFSPYRWANDYVVEMVKKRGPLGIPTSTATLVKPPGTRPEDILLHELVHTSRQLSGLMDDTWLPDGYDNEEEFYAILVTNIYASSMGRPLDLRANHVTFTNLMTPLDSEFLPSRNVLDYRYNTVAKFFRTQPGLAHRLANVQAFFNPLRRYLELQKTPLQQLLDRAMGKAW